MFTNKIIIVETETDNTRSTNDQQKKIQGTPEMNSTINSLSWNQVITPYNESAGIISNHDSTGISLLLECSKFQKDVIETTRELHDLTNRIVSFQTDPRAMEDMNMIIPALMASLMESRERAKRLYRSTLNNHVESFELDIERMFHDLEVELLRTDEMLALHPRRGSFY